MPYSQGTGSGGTTTGGPVTSSPTGTSEEDLFRQLAASVDPTLTGGATAFNLGQQQIGIANQNYLQQMAYNQAMSGYQGQNLQLSEQGTAISQLGNQQQQANAAAQQNIEREQYGLQSGQYPEQSAEAALAYQNALMNTQGSQAISGTQNTVGGRAQMNQLNQNYLYQQKDIARNQALAGLGQAGEEAGFTYSQEQLQNAANQLGLTAQSQGISGQQLLTQLNYTNQQTGLGTQQDVIGLLSNLGQIASGNLQNAGNAFGQISYATNLNKNSGTNYLAPGGK